MKRETAKWIGMTLSILFCATTISLVIAVIGYHCGWKFVIGITAAIAIFAGWLWLIVYFGIKGEPESGSVPDIPVVPPIPPGKQAKYEKKSN